MVFMLDVPDRAVLVWPYPNADPEVHRALTEKVYTRQRTALTTQEFLQLVEVA
jgi:hypothetical protein